MPGVLALQHVLVLRTLQARHPDSKWLREYDILQHCTPLKDVLKSLLLEPVATGCQCRSGVDGVVLALAPLHALEASSIEPFKPAGVKRKRHHTYQKGYSWGGYNGVMLAALACKAVDLLQRCTLLTQPLLVMLGVYRAPVLVGGRYLKTRRDVPQSPWFEDGTALRIGTSSVQEELEAAVLPLFRADSGNLVPAGREDLDVRMLGSGRPFVLHIFNAREPRPSHERLLRCEQQLDERNCGVHVRQLQLVSEAASKAMRAGEGEKRKRYRAVCCAGRALASCDEELLNGLSEFVIHQNTPVRVLHRRAPLLRDRVIHSVRCELVPEHPHWCVLHVEAQAGTYIKEFCHGDFGRSVPSVGTLLGGVEVQIHELDVVHVALDDLQ